MSTGTDHGRDTVSGRTESIGGEAMVDRGISARGDDNCFGAYLLDLSGYDIKESCAFDDGV